MLLLKKKDATEARPEVTDVKEKLPPEEMSSILVLKMKDVAEAYPEEMSAMISLKMKDVTEAYPLVIALLFPLKSAPTSNRSSQNGCLVPNLVSEMDLGKS